MANFSKEMADADGEMLVEYGAMDAMEPLPQETVGRELDMEAVIRLQRIYNFLLFHAIILSILDVQWALLYTFILFLGLNY